MRTGRIRCSFCFSPLRLKNVSRFGGTLVPNLRRWSKILVNHHNRGRGGRRWVVDDGDVRLLLLLGAVTALIVITATYKNGVSVSGYRTALAAQAVSQRKLLTRGGSAGPASPWVGDITVSAWIGKDYTPSGSTTRYLSGESASHQPECQKQLHALTIHPLKGSRVKLLLFGDCRRRACR